MSYAALIPFVILVIAFAGLRLSLARASFIALLTGTLLTQTIFQATDATWRSAAHKTFIMMFEIGLILIGAFFFLETGRRTGVIDSLARLVKSITPDRAIQGLLVTFPMALMVEGSSGFGTPLLVIAPILMALEFEAELCAVLPLLNLVIGIPFGALGTPTRLGFPGASLTPGIFLALAPFVFLAPQVTLFLISKTLRIPHCLWALSLSLVYFFSGRYFSAQGPELAALAPAFFTFGYGLLSSRILFSTSKGRGPFDFKGVLIYGLLLFTLWLGKRLLMDEQIADLGIRIFNPGYVFLVFSVVIVLAHKGVSFGEVARASFARSRSTLTVLLCMTFLVQQMRSNGALEQLTRALSPYLMKEGAPLLGWLGSVFSGTSTMSNLLFSKVVDPESYVPLAAGSAIGVPFAFQTIVAMRALLQNRLSERKLLQLLAPVSFSMLLLTALLQMNT
ncbi:L-lactate permease [bacterium]|nr:L-lactate permease [bacterium]